MIKKSFTINPNRTIDEIRSYKELLVDGTYQGCEIFYPYNKTKEEQLVYLNGVKEYLDYTNDFVCHLPYGGENNPASYQKLEQTMTRIKEAIIFSSNLPVKKLTLHPGYMDGTLEYVDAFNLMIKNIKELCQFASQYGMTIMLENLIGKQEFMKTKEDYFLMKKLIDEPNLKLIFDVAHYYCSHIDESKDIKDFIISCQDDLMHLHVSDNDGTRDKHARIGSGTIDYQLFFDTLNSIGYDGLCSSEVLFNTVDDLKQTAKDIDKYLEKR